MMYCETREIMSKDEQYARGWLRMHGHENTSTVISMAQYAVDLCKLKRNHEEKCWLCRQAQEKQLLPCIVESKS